MKKILIESFGASQTSPRHSPLGYGPIIHLRGNAIETLSRFECEIKAAGQIASAQLRDFARTKRHPLPLPRTKSSPLVVFAKKPSPQPTTSLRYSPIDPLGQNNHFTRFYRHIWSVAFGYSTGSTWENFDRSDRGVACVLFFLRQTTPTNPLFTGVWAIKRQLRRYPNRGDFCQSNFRQARFLTHSSASMHKIHGDSSVMLSTARLAA